MADPAQPPPPGEEAPPPVVVTTTTMTTTTDQQPTVYQVEPQSQPQTQPPPPPPPQPQPVPKTYVAVQPVVTPVAIVVGDCPKCHEANLVQRCNKCGIALAIIFFPIGIIALFTLKDKQCPACGYLEKKCC